MAREGRSSGIEAPEWFLCSSVFRKVPYVTRPVTYIWIFVYACVCTSCVHWCMHVYRGVYILDVYVYIRVYSICIYIYYVYIYVYVYGGVCAYIYVFG